MRQILISAWMVFITLTGCEMSNYRKYEISKSEQAVNNLLGRIADSLKKKYKIRPIGTNVAMPEGNVKLLGLHFQIQGPLLKEEIRKILINLADDFLEFVNSDTSVRPHLQNYPFRIEDIDITLFFIDSNRYEINDPHIGIASISGGKIYYKTLIINNGILAFKSISEEPYEEALKAMQNQ